MYNECPPCTAERVSDICRVLIRGLCCVRTCVSTWRKVKDLIRICVEGYTGFFRCFASPPFPFQFPIVLGNSGIQLAQRIHTKVRNDHVSVQTC